jgi:hypothetical protein
MITKWELAFFQLALFNCSTFSERYYDSLVLCGIFYEVQGRER